MAILNECGQVMVMMQERYPVYIATRGKFINVTGGALEMLRCTKGRGRWLRKKVGALQFFTDRSSRTLTQSGENCGLFWPQ